MLNLLYNGSFAGIFSPRPAEKQQLVAQGWMPWWTAQKENDPIWKNIVPTYAPAEKDAKRVQAVSSSFGTHIAGLWQQMPAISDTEYELSVTTQAWSSEDESSDNMVEPSDCTFQVGIDPTGGFDPNSPLIVWSKPHEPLGHWDTIKVKAKAESAILTVYLKSSFEVPKRSQTAFWQNAICTPVQNKRRPQAVVGPGDAYLTFSPEAPIEDDVVETHISTLRHQKNVQLLVKPPRDGWQWVELDNHGIAKKRQRWQGMFTAENAGIYELRFVADQGARLLSQQLLQVQPRDYVKESAESAPSGEPRQDYRRIYVLLPPTADANWHTAAAKGSFAGRYTVGFSADDAGIGNISYRHVIALNPHHWQEPLTAAWYHQHYPGTRFTPVVANTPKEFEKWLKKWVNNDL
jgi:hypothetical protein